MAETAVIGLSPGIRYNSARLYDRSDTRLMPVFHYSRFL